MHAFSSFLQLRVFFAFLLLQAMLQAVMWRADIVVRGLIAAGCPVDWDCPPPLSRGLVFAAVEEATNESVGELVSCPAAEDNRQ